MNAPMPASLLSPEGDAWLLRGFLLEQAFRDRDNGKMFARTAKVEADYAKLPADKFIGKYQ